MTIISVLKIQLLPHRKHSDFSITLNQLLRFREIIIYYGYHTLILTYKFCGHNAASFDTKADDAYSNRCNFLEFHVIRMFSSSSSPSLTVTLSIHLQCRKSFYSEDSSSRFLWNVGAYLPDYMASHTKIPSGCIWLRMESSQGRTLVNTKIKLRVPYTAEFHDQMIDYILHFGIIVTVIIIIIIIIMTMATMIIQYSSLSIYVLSSKTIKKTIIIIIIIIIANLFPTKIVRFLLQ
jgi:hypothetical protein